MVLRFIVLFALSVSPGFGREIHVAASGRDANDGSAAAPCKTIAAAVALADAGDTITIHEGTYREWVKPLRGGESDAKRITYRAAPGEKAEIKGSEILTLPWTREEGSAWKIVIPQAWFGKNDAFNTYIEGDWFRGDGRNHHTGEIFLNGTSLLELGTKDEVFKWKSNPDPSARDAAPASWYGESDGAQTTIWANFPASDPNKELIELSVRKTCFFPEAEGVNYLTISGLTFSQAATQWAAPTAEQVGMIATHWSKGWIIENNVIHDSRCSGVTLGKERGTGHNVAFVDPGISSANRYIEVVFRALRHGWNKDTVGSHVVRNNTISNCEQAGICGSFGCSDSTIEGNHISNIYRKRQFSGEEMAGIKFHGAIDVLIRRNRIHDCGYGIWLDWMAQGAIVSKNLFYRNTNDIFLEVNHGPILVENNLLLSPIALKNISQGSAYANNLIAGSLSAFTTPERYTPYFLPHSTDVAGLNNVFRGDDRFYGNVFVGAGAKDGPGNKYGLRTMRMPPSDRKKVAPFAVFAADNVYDFGAPNLNDGEANKLEEPDYNPDLRITEEKDGVYLSFTMSESARSHFGEIVDTAKLGKAKVPQQAYENRDGTPLRLDRDYFDHVRTPQNNLAGPFVDLPPGVAKLKVW